MAGKNRAAPKPRPQVPSRENGSLSTVPASSSHRSGAGSLSAPPLRWLSLLLFSLLLLSLFPYPVTTEESFVLPETTLARIEQQYGVQARTRLEQWQELIRSNSKGKDLDIIKKVNLFFNSIPFVADSLHWQKKDYWATPIEFLASNGGDCEDFSIAKYFTLKAMGVDESKLNITYVKALELNQAHMVLTYFPAPGAVPLVIDNLTNALLPASQRKDLLPIYSFNGTGLWLAKQQGRGKMIGSSRRLKRWQDTLGRMTRDFQ
ncbi:transglutaminase-like cysteine peptidase [Desulfogranum mediterraneum]|uniref:transglutaminase-like cysteine peptidase n=1 Tax=Desulfogranum mediterraneum TaxID=160661 RepID=UPI00041234FF|nr:transglutaminase-like cysteine peptidase [Desulfogranum mediterraneum]